MTVDPTVKILDFDSRYASSSLAPSTIIKSNKIVSFAVKRSSYERTEP